MKRSCVVAFSFMLIFSFLMVSTACDAATVKIGVIDTQKILRDSQAAKEAQKVFRRDLEAKRAVLKSKEQEVMVLDQEIKKEGPKMEATVLKNKREKLADEMKELKRLRTDLSDDLKKKDAELTQKILKEIDAIVKDYSKKNKYTIILDRRMVIDFDETVEITNDVIKIYDKKK